MIKFFFLIFVIYSSSLIASNIATINIEYIISKNQDYDLYINDLENKKINIDKQIIYKENTLLENQKSILDSRVLLSQNEFDKKITLNMKLIEDFKIKVDNLNILINQNLDENKSIIINEIINLSNEYAKINNLDLILNENNYFISSKDIDISEKIMSKLEKKKIKLKFFETNIVF